MIYTLDMIIQLILKFYIVLNLVSRLMSIVYWKMAKLMRQIHLIKYNRAMPKGEHYKKVSIG